MIGGIDIGSETHYARAFDWRNYEYTKKPLEFSNTEAGCQMVFIYFPKYKDIYGDLKAVSGRMGLKAAPLPEDIQKLGTEGVNQIWRNCFME